MKQTLSYMVRVRKRAAQERLFSLRGWDLIARRTKAENDMELGEKLRNERNEAPLKSWDDSQDNVQCARRLKGIKDIAYSRRKVSCLLQKFEKKELYFKNAMSQEVPERFEGYRVEFWGEQD